MMEQLEDASAASQPAEAEVSTVEPPVAPGLPLLGAAHELLRDAPGFMLRTARELGPLFRIPLGTRSLTLIAHPDDLRRVLQEEPKAYLRGSSVDLVRPLLGNGLAL